MKKALSLIVAGLFLLVQPGVASAATLTKTFAVSANIPTTSAIGIDAYSMSATSPAVSPVTGTALSFNPMTFNTSYSIWLPDHYYAIDVTTSGAGSTAVSMVYTEGANPNSANPGHGGLGWHAVATFMAKSPTTEVALTGHPKKLLKDVTAESVTQAQLGTSSLRVYLGIVTGDPAAAEPTGAQVFTNLDRPGDYIGSFAITATLS